MAKKKNESTEVTRQTEYRSKKNSNTKKNNTKKTTTEKTLTKKELTEDKTLSTDFVEKDLMSKNKINNDKTDLVTSTRKDEFKMENKNGRVFVNFFLCFVLLIGLGFFLLTLYIDRNDINIFNIISSLLLMLFTICFVPIGLKSKNKVLLFICALLLGSYFGFGIYSSLSSTPTVATYSSGMKDFTNKNLTDVVKWAEKNNISLKQEYEFSDMVGEYEIINQDIKAGTNLKKVKELTVVVSEGPNPYKEIIIPNMVSWDCDRVIEFVEKNYLSNVDVEFVESDKAVDTVIEQSKAGNIKRDEELKLTFSYGEELGYDEVKLIDFTEKTEFEVMFYMKQHHLNYEFAREFSNKIKRNLAMEQDKKPGTLVKVDDEKVKVTFSKGKEIKVPNLLNMSMSEITEWVIENRLKLEFSDKYDEKVKANKVISASHKENDKVEQGDTIKVVISKGSLKMPKFSSYEDFREWADKYEIKYEEKHEFNSDVKAGEVISYSYKTGDVIKNDDVIIVTISDGEAVKVPALDGLTKSQVESKLSKLGLKYSFVYKYSNSVKENLVISQSISAGSEISANTTITVTISKGKNNESEPDNKKTTSSNGSSSNNTNANTEQNCKEEIIPGEKLRKMNDIFRNNNSFDEVKNALISYFNSLNVKVSVVKVTGDEAGNASSGSYIGGLKPSDEVKSCNSTPYVIKVAG